jgi:hypothetical protein
MLIRKNYGNWFLDGIRGCCEHVLRRSIDSPFFLGGSGSCCPVRLQVLLEPGFEGAEPWFRSDFREETCSAYRYLTDFDRKKLAILNFMDYHGLLPTETGLFKRKLIINKGCSSKNQQ